MPEPGFNYRASDINCALGLSQLGKLDTFVARRRELAQRYDTLLAPHAPRVRPIGRVANCTPAWHLFVVLIDFAALGLERAKVINRLKENGIGTQVHYPPVHRQPYYRQRYGNLSFPGADAYYAHCLSLPLFPNMNDSDADRVVEHLAAALDLKHPNA
jgi:dTDP-4-amino-4,6-dideoxygalactose transaminase